MRVSLVQFAPVWQDRAASRKKIAQLLDGAQTDWIVLPEMALSGFTMDLASSTWEEEDEAFFSRLAREKNCAVTVGAVQGGRNQALTFGPDGSILSRYSKRHLFSFAGEGAYYAAGSEASSYRIGELRVAQAICYDLRFPYHFWAEAPGVDAYCVIAAWGAKRAAQWELLLRARAIENQAFVVGVNRVGSEPGVDYSGGSALIDPQGRTILDCGSSEAVLTAELRPEAVAEWRKAFPALEDRLE